LSQSESIPRRRHTEVLLEKTDPADKTALDIGCGDGALVRALAERGALAVGLEVSEGQLARARAAEPVAGADYIAGQAEHLPFPDARFDLAIFFNALHHVERHRMDSALEEACRVLKPGGLLYVAEPLAEGPNFAVMRHFDDETAVRAAAYRALERAAAMPGLEEISEERYLTSPAYADFDTFREQMLHVDPFREQAFAENDAIVQEEFEKFGVPDEKGRIRLDQPIRLNLLRRV
jgi:hypothetical protein